jgi:polyhydroxyalkanoate synthesis regulator phasin
MPAAHDKETHDNFRKELQHELKLVLELTARVDERVKLIVEKQSEVTQRLNNFIDSHNALASRVVTLEATSDLTNAKDIKDRYESIFQKVTRLEASDTASLKEKVDDLEKRVLKIEDHHAGWWSKARYIFDLTVKTAWTILVCYLLYRLGLNTPPIP